ncbi:hypothetical protein [Amycolatopsis sp. NPDC004625]|uniref:hypothetical protein n=1 Tax=Amycolatopsis sp. NPDC004625 TaxID=3154670 RepID=UPI0033BC76A6
MTDSAQVCLHCQNQPDGGGRWAPVDPSAAAQVTEDQVQPRRLQLVVVPPAVRAGTGMIQLRWGATIYGQVELSLCPIDRRGLLLGLHVEPRHRRVTPSWRNTRAPSATLGDGVGCSGAAMCQLRLSSSSTRCSTCGTPAARTSNATATSRSAS